MKSWAEFLIVSFVLSACIHPVDQPRSGIAQYEIRCNINATPEERAAVVAGSALWEPQVSWSFGPDWNGEPVVARQTTNIIYVSFVQVSHPIAVANNWSGWGQFGNTKEVFLVRGRWGNSPWIAGHELGHAMGLNHTTRGLMAPASGDKLTHEDYVEFCRVHTCAAVAGSSE